MIITAESFIFLILFKVFIVSGCSKNNSNDQNEVIKEVILGSSLAGTQNKVKLFVPSNYIAYEDSNGVSLLKTVYPEMKGFSPEEKNVFMMKMGRGDLILSGYL